MTLSFSQTEDCKGCIAFLLFILQEFVRVCGGGLDGKVIWLFLCLDTQIQTKLTIVAHHYKCTPQKHSESDFCCC